ncbi:hypothetical protein I79_006313 [Cricetulus griseus]|uniref:Uncharacterized protein n=1 Tax=Cricetulus griseus TaxID=10029 RepID=G3H7I1_CRIGR|nr:hypothetical protein I79_006313 [Cricetulus griseus]
MALDSQRSTCLCLPSAGIKDVCHHHLAVTSFLTWESHHINLPVAEVTQLLSQGSAHSDHAVAKHDLEVTR